MGQSLAQILAEVGEGDIVNTTLVSNEDDGIASYAVGGLSFHPATGGILFNGPRFRPARLTATGFTMFFSDRKLAIDPPAPPGQFGQSPRQPFNANATETLGVSMTLGLTPIIELAVFGSKSRFVLNPMGDLLVGLGPSFGHSAGSVFVVAFTGIVRPPH